MRGWSEEQGRMARVRQRRAAGEECEGGEQTTSKGGKGAREEKTERRQREEREITVAWTRRREMDKRECEE